MANDINSWTLKGRLAADPELKYTANGSPVCNGRICTETQGKKVDGEWRGTPRFHNFVIWGGLAETFVEGEGAAKGDLAYLAGEAQTRKWQDRQGNDRYTTELNCEAAHVVYKKQSERRSAPRSEANNQNGYGGRGGYGNGNSGGADGGSGGYGGEDDIPF